VKVIRGTWEELSSAVERLAGVEPRAGRVVIQACRVAASPVTAETAGRLAGRLGERYPGLEIEVAVDAPGALVPGAPRGPEAAPPVRLASPVDPDGVVVPSFWLERLQLLTVAPACLDSLCRITAILGAQASVLERLNPSMPRLALVFEAHRLAASDIGIVCGTAGDPATPWWLVGRDDVALEAAVAEAAGLVPWTLPQLRALGVTGPEGITDEMDGVMPALAGLAGARWKSTAYGVGTTLHAASRHARRDVRHAALKLRNVRDLIARWWSSNAKETHRHA